MQSVPEQALTQLRCSVCKNYLSRFPIYWYPEKEDVVCGRCPVSSDQNPIRNLTYEALAKHLRFPCCYHHYGCTKLYSPTEMEEHEKSCTHRRYICPAMPLASCNWQGSAYDIFDHYQQEHKRVALKSPKIELDLDKEVDDNYVLDCNRDSFLISVKLDTVQNILWLGVGFIGYCYYKQCLEYKLELKHPEGKGRIVLPRSQIKSAINMFLNKDAAHRIAIEPVRAILANSQTIILNISFLKTKNGYENGFQTDNLLNENFNTQILNEIECPVCMDYMVPPIAQCAKGHSLCMACKIMVKCCPLCKSRFYDTRNLVLENMTKYIIYHCRYRNFGCRFVSTSQWISSHQSEGCRYAIFHCPKPLCGWLGSLPNIMKHAKNEHKECVLKTNSALYTWLYRGEDNEEVDKTCIITEYMGNVFRIYFKYERGQLFWKFQLVGTKIDAEDFMLELDVIDKSNSGQQLCMKLKCGHFAPFCDEREVEFLKLNRRLLSRFMDERGFSLRWKITRKN